MLDGGSDIATVAHMDSPTAQLNEVDSFRELCTLLEPHVSLSILTDMVNAGDIKSIKREQLLKIARALFSSTTSKDEWKALEDAANQLDTM